MNAENLRHFKHEMRTPVNHIIGYSELVLETADDMGDTAIADVAKGINVCGKTLSQLLERSLVVTPPEMDARQMDLLCRTARPVIEQILSVLRDSAEVIVANSYSSDLERIRIAADQLLILMQNSKAD
jgi:signal transduction histidine kinase